MTVKALKRCATIARLDSSNKTEEGYIDAFVPVTRCGVFPYRNKDGSIRYELRHPKEVFSAKALDTLKMLPIQVEHVEMIDASNVDRLKVGQVGQEISVDGEVVRASIRVDGSRGIEAVDSGKRELSLGYYLDLEPAPPGSEYDGKIFTHVQRNIRYNHLAITDSARLGPDLRIDSMDAEVDSDSNLKPETNMSTKKINVDSVEYDVPVQVAVAFAKTEGRVDALEAEVAAKNAEIKTSKAALDAMKAKCDAAEAEKAAAEKKAADLEEELPELAEKMAKDRSDVLEVAKAVIAGDKMSALDSKTLPEIKNAIIAAKYPEIKLDGKSADYISAMFDTIKAGVRNEDGSEALAESRRKSAAPAGGNTDSNAPVSAEDARKRQDAKINSRWKTPVKAA
jgi:hypothetical protein